MAVRIILHTSRLVLRFLQNIFIFLLAIIISLVSSCLFSAVRAQSLHIEYGNSIFWHNFIILIILPLPIVNPCLAVYTLYRRNIIIPYISHCHSVVFLCCLPSLPKKHRKVMSSVLSIFCSSK